MIILYYSFFPRIIVFALASCLCRIMSCRGRFHLKQAVSLREYLKMNGFSEPFARCYLVPMAAALWSSTAADVMGHSALAMISFFHNHQMLQVFFLVLHVVSVVLHVMARHPAASLSQNDQMSVAGTNRPVLHPHRPRVCFMLAMYGVMLEMASRACSYPYSSSLNTVAVTHIFSGADRLVKVLIGVSSLYTPRTTD